MIIFYIKITKNKSLKVNNKTNTDPIVYPILNVF